MHFLLDVSLLTQRGKTLTPPQGIGLLQYFGLIILSLLHTRINKKESIGIGHQYAFYYDIPIQGGKPLSKNIMKLFAPVTKKVGLHWHHFNQPILPPIVDVDQASERKIQNNK